MYKVSHCLKGMGQKMADKKARILVVGGGFGGLFTALGLAGSGDVTLVTKVDHYLHTPMLYEYMSGEVDAWHIAPTYNELVGDDIKVVVGEVTDIDLDTRKAQIAGYAEPIGYDALVLAPGGETNYWNIPGAAEFALPFRLLSHADEIRKRMSDALDRIPPETDPQDVRELLTFAVVGAGASGVELSTKMADLLRDAIKRRALQGEPRVIILEMGDRIVPGMGTEIREYVQRSLDDLHIDVHLQTRVVQVDSDSVTIEHNGVRSEIKTAGTVWVGGVKMSPLLDKLGLPRNEHGLVLVDPTLQATGREGVFLLGDVAKVADVSPQLAGTAQLAFQESDLAADNVKAFLSGGELKTKHFAELGEAVSLGTENAAVLVGDKPFGGPLARQARFALYTTRLPTWHHRLKVGSSWFFEGTTPRPLLPLGFERT
jgi:NADH:ubiquinone reductase (non-electrogenic)